MLQVKGISKQYKTGELVQNALSGVTLSFRDSEFVAVLGPSGSGKTTLLNIIGGLDRYDSGDLVVNGISTKQYRDRDWDAYRNHTIGFVFQSYNLIPHQSVLANVELALTISGVSRAERRKRAKQALAQVGLAEHAHKKPNQLSGGQMQRVAIARALVNNPEVLLADEPTGALDSETSIQIMELLKEVARDRLVVMVTHNPELAETYATRIVKLRDGKITGDTDPFAPEDGEAEHQSMGRAKMSFLTSLSLSFNNLKTKKGRTLLTAFAGSIGIIGIALILSLSTGVDKYIEDVQRETMTSYPVQIEAETLDLSGFMLQMGGMRGGLIEESGEEPESGVHADHTELEAVEVLESSITENDLTAIKRYLDDPESEIRQYLGENGVVYTYETQFEVLAKDGDGKVLNTNSDPADLEEDAGEKSAFDQMMEQRNRSMELMLGSGGARNFEEMMVGKDTVVSPVITDSYDLLYGKWPESYDEVVLVVDRRNGIDTDVLYQLGFITGEEYLDIKAQVEEDGEADPISWSYADALDRTFSLVPSCDLFTENNDGTFSEMEETDANLEALAEDGLQLKIVGVIRPISGAANATLRSAVAYTSKLTDWVIEHTDASAIVRAQEADPETNVLNGMAFEAIDDEMKVQEAAEYVRGLGTTEKAQLYSMILYYAQTEAAEEEETVEPTAEPTASPAPEGMPEGGFPEGMEGVEGMTGDLPEDVDPSALTPEQLAALQQGEAPKMPTTEPEMAEALDAWLDGEPDEEILLSFYDQYIAGATLDDNLQKFGKVSYDAPDGISIYADTFEDKESISDCITRYNETVDEDSRITYTDYVALLTSSLTQIVDVISYVLIAFVAVSLVVSCIMIGIITHISVLERTKEIGILRALGASKRNISQVFNAETVIIGFVAGLLGVGVSIGLTFPINAIIAHLTGMADVRAFLPPVAAGILVALSVVITVIGGLLPAKSAAKKDPVTALRTE